MPCDMPPQGTHPGTPASSRLTWIALRCRFLWLFLPLLGTLSGCGPSSPAPDPAALGKGTSLSGEHTGAAARNQDATSGPTEESSATSPVRAMFTRTFPAETGVDFSNRIEPDHAMNRLYHSGFVCGGVSIGDVDGDQRPDLFFVSGSGPNRLYRNLGDFRWQEATSDSGVDGGDAWGTGAAMVDIDNDGDLDIYVCNYDHPNALYINDGRGRFQERASDWGLAIVDASLMPVFSDYDRDGDLDVYLITNRYYQENGRPAKPPWKTLPDGRAEVLPEYERYYALTEMQPGRYTIEEYGRADYLFRNDGRGRFEDVSLAAGIQGMGFGLSATWWDYDRDGWIDLFVCNDFDDPDVLYRNQGDGTFRNVLREAIPHTPWFSMGSDFGDINNDGRFDFLCVDMSARSHYKQKTTMGAMNADKLRKVSGPPPQLMRNALYLNSGTGRFWELAYQAGVADSDWSWAAKFADFDNDGWLDLFISNGMVRNFNDSDVPIQQNMLVGKTHWDLYRHLPERPEQNLAFRNDRRLHFEDVSHAWGLAHVGMSYGTATGDLDGDGDLDLVVVNLNEPANIYRNDADKDRPGMMVRLEGRDSNRYGIGAIVTLETSAGRQVRQLSPHTGFLSSNEPAVHFGWESATVPRALRVEWPSGRVQEVAVGQDSRPRMVVAEPAGAPESSGRMAASLQDGESVERAAAPWYRAIDLPDDARHQERPFDDFRAQPLLPNQLSHFGPGLACADVDGDGDEEIYLGGAAGSSGGLWRQREGGQFERMESPALDADAGAEDLGAVFLDYDADGDMDLWVVSGGVEASTEAELADRLYTNDGLGRFTRAGEQVLPKDSQSGGAVSAADFDRDGDLDVFVGGRVVPGQYPKSPRNSLWINRDGRFSDEVASHAETLRESGLVTGAVWTDVDRDGWSDLVLSHEWGPVRLYHNRQGVLEDRTKEAGLDRWNGWWNSLAAVDLDSDQDIDFVVGNFGRNTKYHASATTPAVLYYGDFGGNGQRQLVEAEYEDGHLFPIRGRSCSSQAMPFLKQRFKSYHEFAQADLGKLYTEERLKRAERFTADTLDSGMLRNDGRGRFQFEALPELAQASPVFGIVILEANGDAYPDLYLAQNFFRAQAETGRMDGGMSLLLVGSAEGIFREVEPATSGLVVTGDARATGALDWNGDHWPDLLVAQNDGPLVAYEHRSNAGAVRPFALTLQGPPGNPQAIGARVTIERANGLRQDMEVYAGTGYLSQGSSRIWIGRGVSPEPFRVVIRWPDGTEQREDIAADAEARKVTWGSARPSTAAGGR
jgi:enediyne biosynthesis protein E4